MTCETCNGNTHRGRKCVNPEHPEHLICGACLTRFYVAPGEPIRCPEVGWAGRLDPEHAHPKAQDAPPAEPETEEEPPPF